jgi:hypothetical protein
MFCVTNHFCGHLPIGPLTLTGKPGIISPHNNGQVHFHPVFRGGTECFFADSQQIFRSQARIWIRAAVNFTRREAVEGAQVEVNR